MFIAHLPAGYLLTKTIQRKVPSSKVLRAGLIGSVWPDLDVFYFYLIDNQQTPHHEYLMHWPLFWVAVAGITLFSLKRWRPKYLMIALVFFINIMLHMSLDSIAADMHWMEPFSSRAINMVVVPNRYDFWVLNFILHWTFLLESMICLLAARLAWHDLQWWHNKIACTRIGRQARRGD